MRGARTIRTMFEGTFPGKSKPKTVRKGSNTWKKTIKNLSTASCRSSCEVEADVLVDDSSRYQAVLAATMMESTRPFSLACRRGGCAAKESEARDI